jgi:hypothetical protein
MATAHARPSDMDILNQMKEVEKRLTVRAAQKHALFTEIEQHTKELNTPFTKNLTEEEKKKHVEARQQIAAAYHKAAEAAKKKPLPKTIKPTSQTLKPMALSLTQKFPPFDDTWGFDGMQSFVFSSSIFTLEVRLTPI